MAKNMDTEGEREPSALYLDTAIEIGKQRRNLGKRLREAILAGDVPLALKLAREYVGLPKDGSE